MVRKHEIHRIISEACNACLTELRDFIRNNHFKLGSGVHLLKDMMMNLNEINGDYVVIL